MKLSSFTNDITVYKKIPRILKKKKKKTASTNKNTSSRLRDIGQHTKINHISVYYRSTIQNRKIKKFIIYNHLSPKDMLHKSNKTCTGYRCWRLEKKTLMQEIKDSLNKLGDKPYSWIISRNKESNSQKKLVFTFNSVPVNSSRIFFFW